EVHEVVQTARRAGASIGKADQYYVDLGGDFLEDFGRRDLGVGRFSEALRLKPSFVEALLDPVQKLRRARLANVKEPYRQPVERLGRRLARALDRRGFGGGIAQPVSHSCVS